MNAKQKAYSEWLILRCQQGDEPALSELLKIWHGRFFAYARNRLGDSQAAQDACQEALLSICRNLHKLGDPASFPRWSYTIVERRCVDWQRKRIRDREILRSENEATEQAVASDSRSSTDASLDTERLLAILEPELRALLRLFYLEELSVEELAAVYELPRGTIKSRLFYARKKLQEQLRT